MKIMRKVEFDAAHRVMNHESKCANMHGHRYVAEIHAEAEDLDVLGRVIDFSVLKAKIGGWIDQYWDHTTIVYDQDIQTIAALEQIPRNKPFFQASWNPTAENMASFLLHEICPGLLEGTGVIVKKIVLWETPNCFAEAEIK